VPPKKKFCNAESCYWSRNYVCEESANLVGRGSCLAEAGTTTGRAKSSNDPSFRVAGGQAFLDIPKNQRRPNRSAVPGKREGRFSKKPSGANYSLSKRLWIYEKNIMFVSISRWLSGVLTALASSLLFASLSPAATVNVPEDQPAISVDIPDSWKPEATEKGVACESHRQGGYDLF